MFFQQHALCFLRQTTDFVILKTDKNLGPAILEKDAYVQRAMQDHLSSDTYWQLTSNQAQGWLKAIEWIIHHHVSLYHYIARITTQVLEVQEITASGKFILHHLDSSLAYEPFAYFYLFPKVHKAPWSTCPIVSVSGSLTYGLVKWLDSTL